MLSTAALTVWLSAALTGNAEAEFQQRVAPLLGGRCLSCHNSRERKGDFSLENASDLLESGYVEPGRPDASELINVLISHDGRPPAMPKKAKPLTDEEVGVIRDWIAGGAHWPQGFVVTEPAVTDLNWWSYQPIVKTTPPRFPADSRWSNWIETPVDAFIADQLDRQGLSHSPEADRQTLIRRLSFDLLGLPPDPEEIEAFLADRDPLAYERLVDRMLESPHYGERWARHWLDVVKYADTCGYDKDRLRPNAWPYRDYVIRSFNEDKPYDRFVHEQLAGDVLFPGEPDGILGLGFIAAGPWDFIGHVEVPESKIDGRIARHTDRDEMVSNTLNTFCSVTIQCAQCHHHKFDPITQQHYYNLQSIFAALDRAERPYDLDPQIERERRDLQQTIRLAEQQRAELEAAIAAEGGEELAALEARILDLTPKAAPASKRPEFGYHSAIEPAPDRQKWVEIDLGESVELSRILLHPCHDDFAGIGAGFGFPVRYEVWLTNEPAGFDSGAAEPVILEGPPRTGALAPTEVDAGQRSARYVRIVATQLAERQQDYIFALAELEILDAAGANIALGATVQALDSIEAPDRWRQSNLTDGIWPTAADESAAAALVQALQAKQQLEQRILTPERQKRRAALAEEIQQTRSRLSALPAGRMVYAAATEFEPQGNFTPTHGRPRDVKVLHRGNIQQPVADTSAGAIPLPGIPETFPLPPDSTEAAARAALAEWITRPDHPLTWRTIANRIWQYHFGRGLVDSPNDFGRMGQTPTHPELLDWLAAEFRDQGMSFKRMHRLIVTSAVYRQTTTHDPASATLDADNRFLWRMNRRRLEAEEIRDAMLLASGRLDDQMGGPGYFLFVLERPEHSPHFQYDKFDMDDPATHRRSIYRFVVRSQPDPYMTTLDCADSSQSTPQRNETLTPLQALSLLNNQFSLAMARRFALELEQQPGGDRERVAWAFRRALGRQPLAEELDDLTAFAQARGWPNFCRVLFNLSEFVFVD